MSQHGLASHANRESNTRRSVRGGRSDLSGWSSRAMSTRPSIEMMVRVSGALCPPRGKVVDTGHTSPYRWQPVTAVVAPDVSEVLLDLLGAHLRYARFEIFE